MQPKIVIRHLSGAKSPQTETFSLTDNPVIVLGRQKGATVEFDADRDDTVSRLHAQIRVSEGGRTFLLSDCGSTHGTFLNGEKVTQEVELAPGDEIELSRSVKIVFDLDPRPAEFVSRTRALKTVNIGAKPTTRVQIVAGGDSSKEQATVYPTQERAAPSAGTASRGASKMGLYAAIGLLILCLGGAAFVFAPKILGPRAATASVVLKNTSLTTEDIAQSYSKSTVYIEVKWRLMDKETGKPIYHKQLKISDDVKYPLYVATKSLGVVPWLSTDDDDGVNEAIGFEGSGSGFVVTPSGFILTNKHVATGWKVAGDVPRNAYLVPQGATMASIIAGLSKERIFDPLSTPAASRLARWVPGDGGVLFESGRAMPIGDHVREFDGRNEILRVQFPNSRQSIDAQLVHFSSEADVALIKIESPEQLQPIQLSQEDEINLGQKIVVIGYPGISQLVYAHTLSRAEAGSPHDLKEVIPQPTVTDGVIANLGLSAERVTQGELIGTFGDVYQLTVLATGHGNSGGPVLDTAGKAIGLFTYSRSRGDERVTFAVPIKYGRKLMKAQ